MTLSEQQLATIENYLLDWGIEYPDFYEEILDHYISAVEQKMQNGSTWDNAFADTSYQFAEYEYKIGPMVTHYGFKGFEAAYISKQKKIFSRVVLAYFFELLKSPKILLLPFLIIATFYLNEFLGLLATQYFLMGMLAIATIFNIFKNRKYVNYGKESYWNSEFSGGTIDERKKRAFHPKSIIKMSQTFFSMWIFYGLVIINFYKLLTGTDSLPQDFLVYAILAAVIIVLLDIDFKAKVIQQYYF